MNSQWWFAVALLFGCGCSDSSSEPVEGPDYAGTCAESGPVGTSSLEHCVSASGGCACPVTDTVIVNTASPAGFPAPGQTGTYTDSDGCSNTGTLSANNCQFTDVRTCPDGTTGNALITCSASGDRCEMTMSMNQSGASCTIHEVITPYAQK